MKLPGSRAGFTNSAEFIEFRPDRSGSRLEIGDFLIQNLKNCIKICKKLE
jgi:hypothetical protein